MVDETTLSKALAQTAAKMVAEYERTREMQHRGSKGTVRESLVVNEFLSHYMPRNVQVVGSSEVAACTGDISTQCDLLVVDPTAPFLLETSDYRMAAVENVYGVIEVKSNLTADELKASYVKLASLKAMTKTAFVGAEPGRTRTVYGRQWDYVPTVGMIFAYEGAQLETLGQAMAEVAGEYEDDPHLQVDSVWVMNRGSLTWADPQTRRINVAPNPGDCIRAISATPGQTLMHLTAHLHEQFASAWSSGFRLTDYLGSAELGHTGKVWCPSGVSIKQHLQDGEQT